MGQGLRRFRCLACKRAGGLEASGGARQLRCTACGEVRHADDVFRHYGAVTGRWFVGGAIVASSAWAAAPDGYRLPLLGVGVALILFGVARIVWQWRGMRAVQQG